MLLFVLGMRSYGKKSRLEELVINILLESQFPMSLSEVTEKINELDPQVFQGKTPKKSLYSTLYRREKRREQLGEQLAFVTEKKYNVTLYRLNSKFDISKAGEEIK